ncbi:hypothetical protein [Polaromonas jejuensis]|uniref:Holin of 3TMs, for gene-transfer release n=1 Tax=Polaromonas jejuensis TaxID=457502 RepID=A0ABW0QHD6_9BURK|nr:hypothetical protein [Polaromonas jejuensis]
MFSAIFSFLGGSVFRMIWGEVSAWYTAKQDHSFEIERMRLQGDLDAAQHARNLEAIKVQAELGVKTIQVQAEADVGKIEAEGWFAAVKQSMVPTGIKWVDAWNGIIRPLAASIAILLWVLALNTQGWKMSDWDMELCGVILGFFFASRELTKRGK